MHHIRQPRDRLKLFGGLWLAVGCTVAVPFQSAFGPAHADKSLATITVDYPLEGSIFPLDFAAPTFLWRDESQTAVHWRIDVEFGKGAAIRSESAGEPMQVGEIDPRCVAPTNELPKLTPEQAAAHTWKPDEEKWVALKKRAAGRAVTVTITGYWDDRER